MLVQLKSSKKTTNLNCLDTSFDQIYYSPTGSNQTPIKKRTDIAIKFFRDYFRSSVVSFGQKRPGKIASH